MRNPKEIDVGNTNDVVTKPYLVESSGDRPLTIDQEQEQERGQRQLSMVPELGETSRQPEIRQSFNVSVFFRRSPNGLRRSNGSIFPRRSKGTSN